MHANKLIHQSPVFVKVRGGLAWLALMGIWSLYPIQVHQDTEKNKPAVEKYQTSRLGPDDSAPLKPIKADLLGTIWEELKMVEWDRESKTETDRQLILKEFAH